jgi:hypothetical protein
MAQYHINPETGNPGICKAKENCPFGDIQDHYGSAQLARTSFEIRMSQTSLEPDVLLRNWDYARELVRICQDETINFPNHSQEGGKRITLEDCRKGEVAEGNCWTISNEIIEEVDSALQEANLTSAKADHCALYDPEDNVIIDFTFRQYDPTSPWPLITSPDDWLKRVNQCSSEPYQWDLSDDDNEEN